uniref:Uncharacterized protein n=1 Tax=Odontella aurita TaxID=265563 RepID=A0A7S4M9C8_9STRA|mmetsp:Transcript_14814/g.43233  ORF Transcript_14814/g.43233 Transcript_14814/m.43233 type:complete len:354 (+) Transcript_14814:81-1142(+)
MSNHFSPVRPQRRACALAMVITINALVPAACLSFDQAHSFRSKAISPHPLPPSEAGEALLHSLIGTGQKIGGGAGEFLSAAIPGIRLGHVTEDVGASLRGVWEHGAVGLLATTAGPGEGRGKTDDAPLAERLCFGKCDLTGLGDSDAATNSICLVGPDLEDHFVSIFRSVVASQRARGGTTRLSQHDLHHGHIFRACLRGELSETEEKSKIAIVGTLFHCAEYPSDNCGILRGINLGHCQIGSDCSPTLEDWRFRNALWSAWWPVPTQQVVNNEDTKYWYPSVCVRQAMWLLDGKSHLVEALRMDGTEFGPDCPNNMWEGHLGSHVGDVFHLGGNGVWCLSYCDESGDFCNGG